MGAPDLLRWSFCIGFIFAPLGGAVGPQPVGLSTLILTGRREVKIDTVGVTGGGSCVLFCGLFSPEKHLEC